MTNIHHYLLAHNTSIGFICLYGIVLFAAFFTFGFKSKLKEQTYLELKSRIKTWSVIITGGFLILSFSEVISIIGVMLLCFLSFREFIKSVNIRESDKNVIIFAYLMIPFQFIFIWLNWYSMAIIFIPIYIFLAIPLFLILSKEPQGYLKSVSVIYWAMIASVFCLSHIALIFTLPIDSQNHTFNAISLIFYLLFLTEINDVLQYLWGKTLGKKIMSSKILPTISPNKTLAGFIGGVLSTTLIAYFTTRYFTPLNHLESIGLGLLISTGGFIGDVCMSAIKRDLGVKDYSSMLPGHGGILDRVDSLIYTAPLFFHYLRYLHY